MRLSKYTVQLLADAGCKHAQQCLANSYKLPVEIINGRMFNYLPWPGESTHGFPWQRSWKRLYKMTGQHG